MKFRRDGCQEFVKTMSFPENNYASFVRMQGRGLAADFAGRLSGRRQHLPRWISAVQAICQKSWGSLNGIRGLKPVETTGDSGP